jgi:hypothetical protein
VAFGWHRLAISDRFDIEKMTHVKTWDRKESVKLFLLRDYGINLQPHPRKLSSLGKQRTLPILKLPVQQGPTFWHPVSYK